MFLILIFLKQEKKGLNCLHFKWKINFKLKTDFKLNARMYRRKVDKQNLSVIMVKINLQLIV